MNERHTYPVIERHSATRAVIYNELHRAVCLLQFRKDTGGRKLTMPFWINDGNDNDFVFELITEYTDVATLSDDIEAGLIWIRTCDVERALEDHQGRCSKWPKDKQEKNK